MDEITRYQANINVLNNIFGKPKEVEDKRVPKFKINKVKKGYLALVRFSIFQKWRYLQWNFYDYQKDAPPKGCRASSSFLTSYDKNNGYSYEKCKELIEDYKKYKGVGITIW